MDPLLIIIGILGHLASLNPISGDFPHECTTECIGTIVADVTLV